MSNPAQVLQQLSDDAARLDELERALGDANDRLSEAEDRWDETYDVVAEALTEEFTEQGRLTVPEHVIISAARRENRLAYTNWRRAQRLMSQIERQIGAKKAAMSGRQSELNALRAEAGGPEPLAAGHVYGGRN